MQNVHMTAYSPLGTPDSAEMMKRKDEPKILEDSTVASIAKELGKTPAQVCCHGSVRASPRMNVWPSASLLLS